jgi:hypothetical protein
MTRTRNGLLTVVGLLACGLALAAIASGATSPWAAKANAVCAEWSKKAPAIFGSTPLQPKTPKQKFAYLLKGRKIESGILTDLKRISVPRPPGATRALSLAAADLRELNTLINLYGSVSDAEFNRDFLVWQNDNRANRAFAAIGARGCA